MGMSELIVEINISRISNLVIIMTFMKASKTIAKILEFSKLDLTLSVLPGTSRNNVFVTDKKCPIGRFTSRN